MLPVPANVEAAGGEQLVQLVTGITNVRYLPYYAGAMYVYCSTTYKKRQKAVMAGWIQH